jgi:asparagine synthase (glutamine-hydrolysing)
MCGFLGVFAEPRGPGLGDREHRRFASAAAKLAHRGNSSKGELLHSKASLHHYRLAFRDLSRGLQPMTSSQNEATILFNGELYDFARLRQGVSRPFRTTSDTEVILNGFLEWGPDFFSKLEGEFAFVIWDHRSNEVWAVRDPFGVKPLFWTGSRSETFSELSDYRLGYRLNFQGDLHFASEIKGLGVSLSWDHRGWQRQMVSLYEEMGTAFKGVYALAPGAYLHAREEQGRWIGDMVRFRARKRSPIPAAQRDFRSWSTEVSEAIAKNVEDKLQADVPLGAYLSGGIDSRIAAWEMGQKKGAMETFTVGFTDPDYDESSAVAEFLKAHPNLKGRVLSLDQSALEYSYPIALYHSEMVQPYTNGGAKWWLSRFARRHVRGVLTGDGSDEVFCGYPSYRYLAWFQFACRHPDSLGAQSIYGKRFGGGEKPWEKGLSHQSQGADLKEALRVWGWSYPLHSQWKSLAGRLLGEEGTQKLALSESASIRSYLSEGGSAPLEQWQTYFLRSHFPTHILNWVGDRMEMANTLEGRPIFLSQRLLKLTEEIPSSFLVRGLKDKAVLRAAYSERLGSFAQAPKKQFNAPFLAESDWARDLLSDSNLKASSLAQWLSGSQIQAALKSSLEEKDPLAKSFSRIFLQNCLVSLALDRYLVRGFVPERNLEWEESYLNQMSRTI